MYNISNLLSCKEEAWQLQAYLHLIPSVQKIQRVPTKLTIYRPHSFPRTPNREITGADVPEDEMLLRLFGAGATIRAFYDCIREWQECDVVVQFFATTLFTQK